MWTKAQVDEHNERVAAAEAAARRLLPHAKPQRDQKAALERPAPRAAPRLGKVVVRFVGRRARLLDADNFAASVKDLLDGLQHAGLIPGDSPEHIVLVCEQEKVAHRRDEITTIEIDYPQPL